MSLSQIAAKLRTDALTAPGETFSEPLTHGASVHLRADITSDIGEDGTTEIEFHFKVERTCKLSDEGTKEYTAWLRELDTFRNEKHFNVPPAIKPRMLRGKHKYAAVFIWTERVEIQLPKNPVKPVVDIVMHPLPANDAEMETWALGLGQGIHIAGVNALTGAI